MIRLFLKPISLFLRFFLDGWRTLGLYLRGVCQRQTFRWSENYEIIVVGMYVREKALFYLVVVFESLQGDQDDPVEWDIIQGLCLFGGLLLGSGDC